jgi:Crp-like helix-turn-helix domain
MDHDLATISPATLGFIEHSAMNRLIGSYPSIARALWRETLIDASIFREWLVNVVVRPASARMAHLLAELRERMSAVGLAKGGEFEFPITQAELSEALGLSTVHVNRVLQAFRAERVLDLQRNRVTLADMDKVVESSGFDNSYLHFARNDLPSKGFTREKTGSMRFYFSQPGDLPDDEGVDFPDKESALNEAAQTALLMVRDRPIVTEDFTLSVASDEGPVGSVTVKVSITRADIERNRRSLSE